MSEVVGFVPGVWDLFHIGHLNILRASAERCDRLIAGVLVDEVVVESKGHLPIVPWVERFEIVRNIRCVDDAIQDPSLDKRVAHGIKPFDVLFKGTDWKGTDRGDLLQARVAEVGARVEWLPYTDHTSSTMLRDVLDRLAKSL